MASPINHDGFSTAATVGSKAVKWGLLGAIAAFALPALAIGGTSLLVGAALGGTIGSVIGIGGAVVGALVGGVSAVSYGSAAAVGGALIGVAKGGEQVSRENAAYRNRSTGHKLGQAKTFNDGEVRGIQEGYQIAHADMEPMIQKREQLAFQKGQEYVVGQIQEQMNAQLQAQAAEQKNAKPTGKFAGKELALKCESKAEAVLKQRELDAMAQKHI